MDAEFLQLAREAVTALQLQAAAAGSTSWVEIAQLAVGSGGLIAILVGLKRMGEAGARRDREIDMLAEAMRENTRMVGQALDRQGQALDRQGQALDRQGTALERQGQVLAELLRRNA